MPVVPPPVRVVWSDLSTWLQQQLAEAGKQVSSAFPEFNQGPYIPEMPDELCTLTITGGIGFLMEGAADQISFQIRIRSQQNGQITAETQANVLDSLIYLSPFPTKLVSGQRLLLAARTGGPPTSIGPPDDAYRFDYVCNYYAIIGSS